MASAFKCDRCSEFDEGLPEIRRWETLKQSALGGYTSGKTLKTAELCDNCAERVDYIVAEFIDGAGFVMEVE